MIKINLLAERKPTRERAPILTMTEGEGQWKTYLLLGIVVLALLIIGWKWISLNRQHAHLQAQHEEADRELKRLEEITKKGDLYEKQRDLLKRKVDIILNLKKNQTVPVHILDQISKNLPDFLWLDSLSEKNYVLTINGKATTYTAVSNFYNNLDKSPYFDNVNLGQTKEVSEGVSFSLNCSFVPEEKQQGETKEM